MTAPTTEAVRNRWNNFAESYGEELAPFLTQVGYVLVQHLRLKEAKAVVEIGCGTGTVTQLVAAYRNQETKVVATDLSEKMIELVHKRFGLTSDSESRSCNIEALVADAERLPFEDASFDRYIANLCLMLVPDAEKAFKEARRVLKPGSTAVFSVWGRKEHSPFMTVLAEAAAELNIQLTPTEERSNFHLGELNHLKQQALNAGFKRPIAWYQPVSFDIRSGEEFVRKQLTLWPIVQQLKSVSEDNQKAIWERVKQKVQSIIDAGNPLLFDTAVLVVEA